MKILIDGGKGMLGRTLAHELSAHEIIIADLPDWDITDERGIIEHIGEVKPDVVIHCAAMTKVDDCETNPTLAFAINESGSRNIANACRACGARLIAISTDYVFSGDPPMKPWEWAETDTPRPKTIYGASKLGGEMAIQSILPDALILRIAWLYGDGGPSFIHTMAKLGRKGAPLKVVNDQHGNPTSTKAVAEVIKFMLRHPEVSGIVHATCEGQCTWYELTKELFQRLEIDCEVIPCTTEEFPRPAPRPHYSSLKKGVLGLLGYHPQSWQSALADFISTTSDML